MAARSSTSSEHSVLAEELRKTYGDKRALDGFDLAVPRGTVYGLLGPNGAGKTTAVRILASLVRLDSGRATVGGHDVTREPRAVRRRIGLTGQHVAVDEIITARQNLEMFGRLFHLGAARARQRATELLDQFGLTEAADLQPQGFSGGMRRRLDLASSMILAPEVLFLDEPTTGLDPRGRSEVWEAVRGLTAEGTTVVLTTHYLDEADKLSDRIAVIDQGRNVTEDTPAGLKRAIGGDRIEVVVAEARDIPAVSEAVAQVASGGAAPETDSAELRVHAPVAEGVPALTRVARDLQDEGIAVEDIGLRRPTLDEVFLTLTGGRAHATEKEGTLV
ncbi:ATP-binding cassette domain-containing protein [Streptomyces sp. NBC_01795]|uniref:ATP-binding cassette domain-containing protein n=1 Tax=unclassified Streptomyces TaxID=2593676 RepID=UPI002DDB9B16|nr:MULTISPECIES: ATP-binding cassette domain-containing protein [unclassified Streptomyces]WSA94010.1 ATP-binding cassette domain-containing protein [Streptomyces sp. NBC_01795]WSS13363.1 ATP-binding cassette domain-containing protein [Streptomyces sp. NBC_01186]